MGRKRFDIKHPRRYTDKNGHERTYWTKIGVAWEREQGGFMMELDYVPVGPDIDTGRIKLIAFDPEKEPDDVEE